MKKLLVLLFMIPLAASSQTSSVLPVLLATSSQEPVNAEFKLDRFVASLKPEKSISDVSLLKKVFRQTQKTFLKQYEAYADFNELFTSGKFDCLTATSLFSVVLSQLNFHYRIVETNYHIFLMIETSKGEILLETTDRLGGLVTNPKEICQRIGDYRAGSTASPTANNIYLYHFDLFRDVNPTQLAGLLYYNQAVKAYNNGRLEKCTELLAKAQAAYETPRIAEFSSIFLRSVAQSRLGNQIKKRIAEQLKNITAPRPSVLASR